MLTTRPYRPQDRDQALAILREPRAIDTPNNRIHLAHQDNRLAGLGLWARPDAGDHGTLNITYARDPEDWYTIYSVAAACIEDAIQCGIKTGELVVPDLAKTQRVINDLGLTALPFGLDPSTSTYTSWRFSVELEPTLQLLRSVLQKWPL